MSNPPTIAIVGAGFSGSLVAAHLLRQANSPLTVHLIERTPGQFGRGVAYSTVLDCHLLNVPARNMSAFPDDPEHFLRWARTREKELLSTPCVSEVSPDAFLPRSAYGDYIGAILNEAERGAGHGVRLERYLNEVVGLRDDGSALTLRLAHNGSRRADKAVLALGNFTPGDPPIGDGSFYRSPRYFSNPWAPNVLAGLWSSKSCLMIGSGLTMVDWAITLNQAGYRGTIHSVSRRGLWPQAHRKVDPVDFRIDPASSAPKLRSWLHQIHEFLRESGSDWRAAIDALRPSNQTLWKSLPLPEKRRFLRHLQPYWDCHRHRLAPVVAERLNRLVESGQLVGHAGRILGYQENESGVEVSIHYRGSDEVYRLQVDAVVNCSGSECNYRKLESPLIRDLLQQGLFHPDPLSLGLDVGSDGALVGANGEASNRLFSLGPPQKGVLWETTAVPEIRGQAANLARHLLEDDPTRWAEGVTLTAQSSRMSMSTR